jgi:pantothenate kinase type III
VERFVATCQRNTSGTYRSFIDHDGALPGGEVLPGFNLRLAELFARAEPPAVKAE